jgi:hypothetical protein
MNVFFISNIEYSFCLSDEEERSILDTKNTFAASEITAIPDIQTIYKTQAIHTVQ